MAYGPRSRRLQITTIVPPTPASDIRSAMLGLVLSDVLESRHQVTIVAEQNSYIVSSMYRSGDEVKIHHHIDLFFSYSLTRPVVLQQGAKHFSSCSLPSRLLALERSVTRFIHGAKGLTSIDPHLCQFQEWSMLVQDMVVGADQPAELPRQKLATCVIVIWAQEQFSGSAICILIVDKERNAEGHKGVQDDEASARLGERRLRDVPRR